MFLSVLHNNISCCQYILNGDFELNNAPFGVDQLDMTNAQFNSMVDYCHSFGDFALTNIDLLTSATWVGFPQTGNWYVGIHGSGVDQFSMELSDSLVIGQEYTISFYDNTNGNPCTTPIEIGISLTNNNFGSLVYTTPVAPSVGEWKPRVFSFAATTSAKHITVRAKGNCWVAVDNFCLTIDTGCIELPKLQMPNVFTPNEDGVNDIFKPISYQGIKEGTLTIINRWGNKVFETNDINSGWNGLHNNKECTEGVYYWIVTYTDIFDETKTENGFLTLIR